jgi:hypothetical protein
MTLQRYMILRGTLKPQRGRAIEITAMLNSRANFNFINYRFTIKYNLLLTFKTRKILLQVIDSTSIILSSISYYTSLSELAFRKFSKTISLDIISLSDYNIVLDIP